MLLDSLHRCNFSHMAKYTRNLPRIFQSTQLSPPKHKLHLRTFKFINIFPRSDYPQGAKILQTNILDIAPHFKPTNRFQYLHFNSCHPPHTFKGLILGEAIRMLRASSDPLTFATALETIKKALIARKYPSKLICNTFKKVTFNSRQQLLKHNRPKKIFPGPGCADLRIPYYPAKHPDRVQASLPNITQDQPITSVLTYKGNKPLSNKLVNSLIKGAPSTKINKNITPL